MALDNIGAVHQFVHPTIWSVSHPSAAPPTGAATDFADRQFSVSGMLSDVGKIGKVLVLDCAG